MKFRLQTKFNKIIYFMNHVYRLLVIYYYFLNDNILNTYEYEEYLKLHN